MPRGLHSANPPELSEYGMVVDPERPWLGGYFPDGDPASFCPEVWEWMLGKFPIRSVIDVGCGAGKELDWFKARGCDVLGVDGLPPEHLNITRHDYTTGPYVPDREFDLCWSCEFVEHVEEEYVLNFIATFYSAHYVMMTHGLTWQGGHHHVNLQRPEYWIDRMMQSGFTLLGRDTIESRDRALQHYWKHSGLVFRRTK
jgi:SAM-dependent methyltransferase